MATWATTLQAERWLDEVVLAGTATDVVQADFSELFSLPAGLGDVAIMEIYVRATGLTTPTANLELVGCSADVLSADGATTLDIVGIQRWSKLSATIYGTYFSPDPLVLWRQPEKLRLFSVDMEGGTAGDLAVFAKCVRVRPIEVSASPLQLVR